jgi:glycosyltransferase involved in cell wall biosynthesis
MAIFNGEEYIELQLQSIIKQLSTDDEIIIIDDYSTDNSLNIIKSINDSRIKIFRNSKNNGHVYSFGQAIKQASKEIIFMSDQDDIWLDNRIVLMKNFLLRSNAMLVSSNSNFIDDKGNSIDFSCFGINSKTSNDNVHNLVYIFLGKINYWGCTMAFKSEFRDVILPIPFYVESHDLWIALTANIMKSNLHIDEVTLNRRIHGNNVSIINRKFILKLWSRIIFFISIVNIVIRIKKMKKNENYRLSSLYELHNGHN